MRVENWDDPDELSMVRERLAVSRAARCPFERAWPRALSDLSLRDRRPLVATREAWAAAYEGRLASGPEAAARHLHELLDGASGDRGELALIA